MRSGLAITLCPTPTGKSSTNLYVASVQLQFPRPGLGDLLRRVLVRSTAPELALEKRKFVAGTSRSGIDHERASDMIVHGQNLKKTAIEQLF